MRCTFVNLNALPWRTCPLRRSSTVRSRTTMTRESILVIDDADVRLGYNILLGPNDG